MSAADTLTLVERCGRLVGRIDSLEQAAARCARSLDDLASTVTDRATARALRAIATELRTQSEVTR